MISHANVNSRFRRLGAKKSVVLNRLEVHREEPQSIIAFARDKKCVFQIGKSEFIVVGLEGRSAVEQVLVGIAKAKPCEQLRDTLHDLKSKFDLDSWRMTITPRSQRAPSS